MLLQVAEFPVEPEIARILDALGYGSIQRLYWLLRAMVDWRGGSGWLPRKDLYDEAVRIGLARTPRTFRHWLQRGDGRFWNVDSQHDRVYIRSLVKLTAWLVRQAILTGQSNLIRTNPPGVNFVYCSFGGTLAEWRATLQAAWFFSRRPRTRELSRYTWSQLFGRSRRTFLRWERRGKITKRENTVEYSDFDLAPRHAIAYLAHVRGADGTVRQVVRIAARHSNSYSIQAMRVKHQRALPGILRRTAIRAVEAVSDAACLPPRICGAAADVRGSRGFSATGRQNFYASNGGAGYDALKRLRRHQRQHQDDEGPHFVFDGLSSRHGRGHYRHTVNGDVPVLRSDPQEHAVIRSAFMRSDGTFIPRRSLCEL